MHEYTVSNRIQQLRYAYDEIADDVKTGAKTHRTLDRSRLFNEPLSFGQFPV